MCLAQDRHLCRKIARFSWRVKGWEPGLPGLSRQFKKSSNICEEQSRTAHWWSALLLLSIAFNSFTRLLFTSRFCLYRHGAARFTVEEFPPLDGRFSLLRRKDFPSYRGKISPSIVEGILASWKDLPG